MRRVAACMDSIARALARFAACSVLTLASDVASSALSDARDQNSQPRRIERTNAAARYSQSFDAPPVSSVSGLNIIAPSVKIVPV